ncbi:MAG: phosphate-starvation-inducible protein PsiE [Gammaproteobacteria bacterium]|tara:strand:+ start:5066 stop:5449 length:384 start_codon:yes stop_codon:yes gene_type:complete
MNRINRLFEYLEDLILSIIAVMTLGAVGFELFSVYQRGSIELADLLLMFIYAEVLGMVAIYFRSHVLPVIYPLFIGITALARLIVLQGKDSMPEQLIYEAGSILLLSLAALLLKDVKVTLTHNKKKT